MKTDVKTIFSTPNDTEIKMERVYAAPANRIFKAMTDPTLIPQWWGPSEFTTKVEKMDVRLGGGWRFIQRDKEGNEYAFHGVYHDIVPSKHLEYSFIYEGAPNDMMTEIVDLENEAGMTKVKINDIFSSSERRKQALDTGMRDGAIETMERFADLVEAPSS